MKTNSFATPVAGTPRTHTAFTLIELLVVIAIMALLAGLPRATRAAPAMASSAAVGPPTIRLSTSLMTTAVIRGWPTTFSVAASGTQPLSYQWRRDGQDLPGQTNRLLSLRAAQREDDGDYTVVVSNPEGVATSYVARLWVVPPVNEFTKANFTKDAGPRLPYFYILPESYDPSKSYPLVILLHGSPADESNYLGIIESGLADFITFAAYRRQAVQPTIFVLPSRRVGENEWTDQYLRLILGMADSLIGTFAIDTDRIYVMGFSEGVHAVWDLLGFRPDFFAAAVVMAGSQGSTRAASFKHVPLWAFVAADDNLVGSTREVVRRLRLSGGNVIYTEFKTGGHGQGILSALSTPVMLEWVLAQRRGLASTTEPLLAINTPTGDAFYTAVADHVDLAGRAAALGQAVTQVAWENLTTRAKGNASGANDWLAEGIPLLRNQTNLIVVTATTTSWSPVLGGATTFNDTLAVLASPIVATLVLQATSVLFNWSGGAPPYHVQGTTNLASGEWVEILRNVTAPVTLPIESEPHFYRIAAGD